MMTQIPRSDPGDANVDMFGQTWKGDFDIHNVHSCHVECVVLMSRADR